MFSNISTKFMFIHFPVASITAIRSWLNTEGETAGKQRCLCRALPGILLHRPGSEGGMAACVETGITRLLQLVLRKKPHSSAKCCVFKVRDKMPFSFSLQFKQLKLPLL